MNFARGSHIYRSRSPKLEPGESRLSCARGRSARASLVDVFVADMQPAAVLLAEEHEVAAAIHQPVPCFLVLSGLFGLEPIRPQALADFAIGLEETQKFGARNGRLLLIDAVYERKGAELGYRLLVVRRYGGGEGRARLDEFRRRRLRPRPLDQREACRAGDEDAHIDHFRLHGVIVEPVPNPTLRADDHNQWRQSRPRPGAS